MPEARKDFTTALPVPDPTEKTTALIMHEVAVLKEMILSRITSMDKAMDVFSENITRVPTQLDKEISQLRALVYARLDAIELRLKESREVLLQLPMQRTAEIEHLHQLLNEKLSTVNEKFAGVHTQFSERDVRVEQSAKDTKTAIDAALSAQEKAFQNQNQNFVQSIAKSETATVKSIDQQGMLIATTALATNSKIDDLKERVLRSEATMVTLASQRNDALAVRVDQRAQGASIAQVVGVVAAILFGLVSLAISVVYHAAK